VTLGIDGSEGNLWSSYFSLSQADIFNYLINDNSDILVSDSSYPNNFLWDWNGWHWNGYESGLEITDSSILFDFSQASDNGTIDLTTQNIPEPVTIILLGTGGVFVLWRKRGEE